MAIAFENLDPTTRNYMRNEVNLDLEQDRVYRSRHLNTGFKDAWEDALIEAVTTNDDAWLEQQVESQNMLKDTYQKRTPSGGMTIAKVPVNAAQTLAEGEFNRYYCRGLCARAIEEGKQVEVYRGKAVQNARSASVAMIGRVINPAELLEDLRANPLDTALGLPPGPNSGLTIKLV
ncbi:hypothetical protein [Shewanella sp. cp20]|uniref:hypothetical protein n=1 Tax=Shewanella sp. cp20 TaxID=1521167 RepID=UPI0005A0CCE3|nr:hypothetical protein [Shewanella sp. cp20]KIO37403.1 hypothetical protein DB48_06305 [Shewanella sp. cp20]